MSGSGAISIDRPFEELADLLSSRPADWVVAFVRIAAHAGEAATARSLGLTSSSGSREIHVELLRPLPGTGENEMVVPLRWRTSGFRWVPPTYAGRLVVRTVSPTACEIELDGSYALPPSVEDDAGAEAAAIANRAAVATFLRSLRAAAEERPRQTV